MGRPSARLCSACCPRYGPENGQGTPDLHFRGALDEFLKNTAGGASGVVAALFESGHGAERFHGIGGTLHGVPLQKAGDPPFKPGRDVPPQEFHRVGFALEVGVDQFGNVVSIEGGMARDGFVKNTA